MISAALALVGLVAAQPPARAAGSHSLTTLRVELTTTSDWATVTLKGISARVQRTVEVSNGAKVTTKANEWTIVPVSGQPGTLVVDLVSSPADPTPSMTVQKGMAGTATARITSRNGGSDLPEVASVTVDSHYRSSNSATTSVDYQQLDVGGLVVPPIDGRRLTLAFYYPWFGPNAPSDWSITPDKPTGAYDTTDPTSVATMVEEAAGAGINGFAVSWDGSHTGAVDLLLAAAARHPGFVVAPLLEINNWVSTGLMGQTRFDVVGAAAATRDYFTRVPAGTALEVNGRPVLMTFGMWRLSVADWNALRSLLTDLNPFIVGDRAASNFPVEGFYNYDPNNRQIPGLEARNDDGVNLTRLESVLDPAVPQLLWAATASPGFDNRGSAPLLQARRTDRADGERYDQTWSVALDSMPDWMLITSWNEWYEQTNIAPGTQTGVRALNQTRWWTGQFRGA